MLAALFVAVASVGCGGRVEVGGDGDGSGGNPPIDDPCTPPNADVSSEDAERLARCAPGFPEGAGLVRVWSSGDGTMTEDGKDRTWNLLFWDEAHALRASASVSHLPGKPLQVDFSKGDGTWDCTGFPLANVPSSVVVPDARQRILAKFGEQAGHLNLFYRQELPCAGETPQPAHEVGLMWTAASPDGGPNSHVAYDVLYADDGTWLQTCGPCAYGPFCDECPSP
jgi:hypothetical protein